MAAQAWFSRNETAVEPGSSAVLHLTVANLGDTTDTFSITPVGLAAAWTTIRPAVVTLFGGSEEILDIEVNAPLLPSTTAGPTALTVRVVSQSDPDDVTTAESTVLVGVRSDRRIQMLQPAIRSRRRATYELMFENRGNTQASCRLRLADPSGRLDGDFDPPSIGVEPGATSVAKLKVRAKRRQWERRSRSISFRVEADQPGHTTAATSATLVQAPMVPERLLSRLAMVVAGAGALALAWFGLIRPAIDRAVDDALEDRPATQVVVETTVPTGAVDTSIPVVTVPASEDADDTPFNVRLSPISPVGETQAATYVVPAGSSLRISDVVFQNPNFDSGTAVLRRGTEVLFAWRLENVTFDDQKSFVGDIVVASGEQLILEVFCAGVGVPTIGTCSPALQVVGALRLDG
jgi:hypothetical protein